MKKKLMIVIFSLVVILVLVMSVLSMKAQVEPLTSFDAPTFNLNLTETKYTTYLSERPSGSLTGNEDSHYNSVDSTYSTDAIVRPVSESFGYSIETIELKRNAWIEFEVTVEVSGSYEFELAYYYTGEELLAPKFGVLIDDVYPYYESRQTSLPIVWIPNQLSIGEDLQTVIDFSVDRYNNDIQPRSEIKRDWQENALNDASFYHLDPLQYYLTQGSHVIKIIAHNDGMLIGSLSLKAPNEIIDYETYYASKTNLFHYEDILSLEAEYYASKSDPSIKLYSDKRSGSTPFSVSDSRLNAIDAYTWDEAGRSVTWDIYVPEEGLYHLGFKYIQYRLTNISSFREISVNGEVPFTELKNVGFPYTSDWANIVLGNDDPYWIHLNAGNNTITLTSTIDSYLPVIETIESTLSAITSLTIEIQKLTGGNTDTYRDWDLTDYIPDLASRLSLWADWLESSYRYAHSVNGMTDSAAQLVNLKIAFNQLRELAEDANDLPNRMNLLSEGTSSVSKYLGDMILILTKQSMGLEKIYLFGSEEDLPSPKANLLKSISIGIQKFFQSFVKDTIEVTDDANTIDVWVNRPRANIDLMQQYVDQTFTPQTGIHVNLSLMPNPTKLILANAANIEPDVAMGVTSQTPFNFAIRNAAADLRGFSGFEEVVSHFAKGSMIPYVYGDGVYGFPETQDFYLTIFRTDIMSQINQPIPQTWEEVKGMLPALRRMGMNYYIPLGGSNSYKSFTLTSGFYEQFGASIYSSDGLSTDIDSEAGIAAMQMMTDLFTINDLPIGISNFYNHFRYGNLPIGIANSQQYLQLLIAAPEIKGNWDVALYPGTDDGEGNILRYTSAPTSATMIFNSSDKQALAFDFLAWWHSTEVQISFTSDIQKMFGKEYMWFSSNLSALAAMSIDSNHKEIILEQLNWIVEAPNTPGGYYIEREISNVWNSVVMSDANLRGAIDDATLSANRELWRKLDEFGYVDGALVIQNYIVPTRSTIDLWLTERGDNDE